jgi:hypothetical protein
MMSQTEAAIGSLTDRDGNCFPVSIVPAYDADDCAFVALGLESPPALTVGCQDGALRALYHMTGPLDYREVPVEWRYSDDGAYAVVTVPEGIVRIPATCVRG